MATKTITDYINWNVGTYQGPKPVTILDANGNVLASIGGGTQYADGAAAPTHPIGNEIVYNNAGTMTAVSAANPLPTSATVTPAANQRVSSTSGDFVAGSIVDLATLSAIVSGGKGAVKAGAGDFADLATLAGIVSSSKAAVKAANGDFVDGALATLGAKADTAITDSTTTNSGMSFIKGFVKILADVWDSVNHLLHQNLKQVGGSAIALGRTTKSASLPVTMASDQDNINIALNSIAASLSNANPVPVLNVAQTGYVAAYGSNPSALTANTDALFKWGAGGTTQVNHIMLQNNTTINVNFDLDVATNAGSPILAPGQTLFLDVQTTAVHVQTNGTPNLNGSTANNVIVRGWL